MNKLCNFATCWIYIEILLGADHILHISRIRVKRPLYEYIVLALVPTSCLLKLSEFMACVFSENETSVKR